MKPIKLAKLWGYVRYSTAAEAGFVLPVFAQESAVDFYLQVPDVRSEAIEAFLKVEDFPIDEVEETKAKRTVRVGDPLIFGFEDARGNLSFGTLAELDAVLSNFAQTSDDTATKLQIAELTGSAPERRQLRREMIRLVERDSGEEASENFSQTSLFIQAIWDSVLASVPDAKLALLAEHKKWLLLEADLNLPGIFPLRIQEWMRDELGVDSSVIANDLKEELPETSKNLELHPDIKPEILRDRLNKDLEKIYAEPRQEARVARLIRRVMENPGVGRHLAEQYIDRAQFANKATRLVTNNIDNFDLSPDPSFVDWLVGELYTMAYPRQRGVLLYELARHLGDFPAFAEPIMARAHHSQAEAVQLARKAIEECITNPRGPRRAFYPPRPISSPSYVLRERPLSRKV